MSDRMSQDSAYAHRIFRAIHEISLETKSFRESIGFHLPQDMQQLVVRLNNNKCNLVEYSNKINSLTETDLIGDGNNCGVNSLKRKHPCDDSNIVGQQNTTGNVNIKSENEQSNELVDNDASVSTSSLSLNDYEPKPKKVCVSSESPGDTTVKSNSTFVQQPASVATTITTTTDELQTPTFIDKDLTDVFLPSKSSPSVSVVKTEHQELNISSEKLFLQTSIVYNPESDPLERFPTDQLSRLNPKILIEVTKLQELSIHVEGNPCPPCIDDMESYATCLDAGEWNTSCHLKLTYLDKAHHLPCELPELYIRLPSDYLQTGQLNWYYLPKLKYISLISNSNKDINQLENSERYLNLYYDELNKQFDRMRKLTDYRKNLITIGKTWTAIICSSVARLYKFDHNLLTISSIKSAQQKSQLAY